MTDTDELRQQIVAALTAAGWGPDLTPCVVADVLPVVTAWAEQQAQQRVAEAISSRPRGGRPGGAGMRGGPRPRGRCSVCGRDVGTTEGGVNAVWHNPPSRTFPPCEGGGQPVQAIADALTAED